MTTPQYLYRVMDVERISDGDTYWLRLDIGFRHTLLCHVRLLGWDTPETNTKDIRERGAGQDAKAEAEAWFALAMDPALNEAPVWVQTEKDPDVYGRWLGRIWTGFGDDDRQYLGDILAEQGLASAWPTKWREAYPE